MTEDPGAIGQTWIVGAAFDKGLAVASAILLLQTVIFVRYKPRFTQHWDSAARWSIAIYLAGLTLLIPGFLKVDSAGLGQWLRGGAMIAVLLIAYLMDLPRAVRGKPVILFVAANPEGSNELALAKECAEIERALQRSKGRDDFDFRSKWSVNVQDMMDHLRALKPIMVHFAGHGASWLNASNRNSTVARDVAPDEVGIAMGGIYLMDIVRGTYVTGDALSSMIKSTAPSVRAVILNACYTGSLAQDLCKVVDCAVGMQGPINDEAARAFAVGFYSGLGSRASLGMAFDQGKAAADASIPGAGNQALIKARKGVDVHHVFLSLHRKWLPRGPMVTLFSILGAIAIPVLIGRSPPVSVQLKLEGRNGNLSSPPVIWLYDNPMMYNSNIELSKDVEIGRELTDAAQDESLFTELSKFCIVAPVSGQTLKLEIIDANARECAGAACDANGKSVMDPNAGVESLLRAGHVRHYGQIPAKCTSLAMEVYKPVNTGDYAMCCLEYDTPLRFAKQSKVHFRVHLSLTH